MITDHDTSLLREYAKKAREGGDRLLALNYFQAIYDLEPSNIWINLDIATELVELERFDEAQELLLPLEKTGQHIGRINHLFGRIYQFQGRQEASILAFEKGIRENPNFVHNYLALANFYIDRANYDAADLILVKGLQNTSDHYWLHLLKVRIAKARGLVHLAIDQAESLLGNRSGDFHISTVLIECLLKHGKTKRAKELLEQIQVSQHDHRDRVDILRARLYLCEFQLDEAIDILQDVLKRASQVVDAHELLTLIFLMRCDLDKAKLAYQKTVQAKETHALPQTRSQAKGGMNFMRLLDFGTNPFALKKLKIARSLPLLEQPKAIAQVLHEEPGHLGTSIALLTVLRQAGVMAQTSPISLGEAKPIPKKIVQFWDDSTIPEDIGFGMMCAQANNPDYEYEVFDRQMADTFVAQNCSKTIVRAYRLANHPAMRADVFRLAYLLANGGVYIDADDRCIQPLSTLFPTGFELVVAQEMDGSIGNNFIASSPNHPWVAHSLNMVAMFINERQGDNIWMVSGPGAISGSFTRFYLNDFLKSQMPFGVQVWPQHKVERHVSMHLPYRYKKEGGHWMSQSRSENSLYRR